MRIASSRVYPSLMGSKSLTCAAIFVLNIETSNSVTRLTAETPPIIFFQHASFPTPFGEMIPTPVTTTLRDIFLPHSDPRYWMLDKSTRGSSIQDLASNLLSIKFECFFDFFYSKISFPLLNLVDHLKNPRV